MPTTGSLLLWVIGGLTLPSLAVGTLICVPWAQRQAIYMHGFRTSRSLDELKAPERLGFAQHQVAPFYIVTPDGFTLLAWHIVPLGLYLKHEERFLRQSKSSGNGGPPHGDIRETVGFEMLRTDPEARLVIYMHGSSGTLSSGWRVNSYKALSSAAPEKVHVLAFDYRGFGLSEGSPSEEGLITDATAVVTWAVKVAGIPSDRIVICGHSMGAGVAIALTKRLVTHNVQFAGLILSGGFTDVAAIVKTYNVLGLPLLKPIQMIPGLANLFASRLESKWRNCDRLAELVRLSEKDYHIEIIHAKDDSITPYQHSLELYQRALEEAVSPKIRIEEMDLGEAGQRWTSRTEKGIIRLSLPLFGDHDGVIHQAPVVAAVMRAFRLAGIEQ